MECLYIVLPCYNEGAGLEGTIAAVRDKLQFLIEKHIVADGSSMLFVDDGSSDNSWDVIRDAHLQCAMVKGIRLASNRGKENALIAGLMEALNRADIVVTIDADLQHDIDAIDDFLKQRAAGYDLVYGIKSSRGRETFVRKAGAWMFYRIMQKLGAPVQRDNSDYCLMSKKVIEALSEYKESNIMFRALLYQLGFKKKAVKFYVKERGAGESKMTMSKLIGLSLDAITSFSITPLRVIALLGCIMLFVSLVMIGWVLYDFFVLGTPNGWATLSCSIWFIGGVIAFSLATIGEYVGKMYLETKRRPRYFIDERLL